MKTISFLLFASILFASCSNTKQNDAIKTQTDFKTFAPTPPMGWNSFDAYDSRINEAEFKATVDYMADNLLELGYEYAIIDYIWWHPEPGNWDTPRRFGHPNIRYKSDSSLWHPEYINMDEFGRLTPSVERFPSAANNAGFKPLADYVHNKGMKFGIHIMRGIHRKAWLNKTPIKGTQLTACDIAETFDTCNWCNHMWGVDPTKEGSQEYYNSLFELYAQWGVDFVKADDMMVPPYHKGDIEMMRRAIDNCGRPIILSLSCGEAPHSQANHLNTNANMWRISADFWDHWDRLLHNFDLIEEWSAYIGNGTWPDADMIPFGKLSLNNRPHGNERMTHFTFEEQKTLMSLWSMGKSPLIIGADLLSMDSITHYMLTNKDILYIDQHSIDNRQIHKKNNEVIWMAKDSKSDTQYLAMFNLSDNAKNITFYLEWEHLRKTYTLQELWTKKLFNNVSNSFTINIPAHGTKIFSLNETK